MKITLFLILPLFIANIFATPAFDVLIQAAIKGDAQFFTEHKKTAAVNRTNKNGATALHFASYYGHTKVVKLLIERLATINTATKNNDDFLIENLTAASGITPLMLAAFKGYVSIVKELLAAGAKVDAQDSAGQTALHYAILADDAWPDRPSDHNHLEIIKLLLKHGAKTDLEDVHGNSALYYYSLIAGLVAGHGPHGFSYEESARDNDELYKTMKK